MKSTRIAILLSFVLTVAISSCSDDNSPGTSNDNNGGGIDTGACAGGPITVSDIDGNVYNVVSIGNQCWMKENLKTTRYKNGTPIPSGLSEVQWQATTNGACADFDNNSTNTAVYGKLYNWYAVADTNGLCPTGWHEPEDWEWNLLVKSIDPNVDTNCLNCNQSPTAGGAMKEKGLTHWASPNIGATNKSGFTGLPGGYRLDNGTYSGIGANGFWWTATENSSSSAFNRDLINSLKVVSKYSNAKPCGFSLRCVRD